MFEDLQVESVERVRLRINITESDLPASLKLLVERQVSDVINGLDPLVRVQNPVFSLEQAKLDSMYLYEWNYLGALVDQIVNSSFLPYVIDLPLTLSEGGHPDVEISILVDASRGCRMFTYTLNENYELERRITRIPTLTLDTSIVMAKWKNEPGSNTVDRLLDLALERPLSLRVTERIREDVPRPKLSNEIDRLPELGIKFVGSVIRPDSWRAGIDYAGSVEFEEAYNQSTTSEERLKKKDWKDWDHLHAHYLSKRDVFLTFDSTFQRKASSLTEILGIVIMDPEEYLADLELANSASPDER